MSPPSSSTSSSERSGRRERLDALAALAWTIAALACLDVGVNVAFRPPADSRAPLSPIQWYFEYGRSTEGKLDRMLGRTDETTAAVCFAGWLDPPPGAGQPTAPIAGSDRLVAFYGMSFTDQIAKALHESDPRFTVRTIAGHSAPPSFAYAAYTVDRGRHRADTVVLGVLDSAVAGLLSNNGLCRSFEWPSPFFYPSYSEAGGALLRSEPPVRSLAELRDAWFDPAGRARLVDALRKHDAYFSPFFFSKNALDDSAIVRTIRRALFRRRLERIQSRYENSEGFIEDSEAVRILRAIVRRFATDARDEGKLPVVLMIQDRASGNRLQGALQPVLDDDAILSLNTHSFCPTNDRTLFTPDGHFTPEGNRKIAAVLARLLRDDLPPKPPR